jgi:glycosyltransferase involved in cell wall biosynthesis
MMDTQTNPARTPSGLSPPSSNMCRLPSVTGSQPSKPEPAVSGTDDQPTPPEVALLTGGGDKPYALGITEALTKAGLTVDFIGSDDLDLPELRRNPHVCFLNLRGDQRTNATFAQKARRVITYYLRLLRYAATAKPRVFHILWNNKFELFDRTLLMHYYKCLGKKVVLTAHNVNVGKRDGTNSFLNRLSLKIQYQLADHIFVHTQAMKSELLVDFAVPEQKVSVIPFGINNTVPNTALTTVEAKRKLGIGQSDKAMLFYGNIAPYKGLEYSIAALAKLAQAHPEYRLIIAGRVKQFITAGRLNANSDSYWTDIQAAIAQDGLRKNVVKRIEFIPDEETELYFKAADVLLLPYTHIFQSGVLFLAYSFGLPVITADVGSLKAEIIEGKTGFVFPAKDTTALANAIETYFASDLYKGLMDRRQEIRAYANERYSWTKVAAITTRVYSCLIEN